VLQHFDLPQVAGSLAGRKVTVVNPVDQMKRTVSEEEVKKTCAPAEAAFARKDGGRFRILKQCGRGI
jgi:hypothetical protein